MGVPDQGSRHHRRVEDERVLRTLRITRHELMAALRQSGQTKVAQVHAAILETNGRINVLGRRNPP